jgi:hypothetical protein
MGKPPPHYTEEEKLAALELAAAVGRRAAVRQLGISASTFQRWTETYPQQWSDLRAGDLEAQKQGYAQRLEDLAEQYATLEFQALERVESVLPQSGPKEIAGIIKALGASRGVAAVGARAARGEDRDIVEHNINFPALEAAMERLLERGDQAPQLPTHVENEAEHEQLAAVRVGTD